MSPPRRYPRWQDALGATIAGVFPVGLTLAVLRNPSRYNPFALFSGIGHTTLVHLGARPTADPGIYTTQYALGVRAAEALVHGHVPWWNPFEGLGAPLIGELESGGLFPLTPLLLLRDGELIFHLALLAIAGVATYFLLRELRCGPLVASIGGMLYATNGTFAWLANAVASPVCFLPVMLLGVERARRAAQDGRAGGWRWLAVGTALALLAGFIEVAALGLILVAVVAVQRAFTIKRDQVAAFARKVLGALAVGMAIAAPVLVAFQGFLANGYVAQHAGNAADHGLQPAYVPMLVAPYLFGRVGANPFPEVHGIWGAVGGYAGFALIALAVASLFFRRDRGLRIVLAAWVAISLADTMGAPIVKNLIAVVPVTQHIVLYRYFPPTWELALVLLAALALRDFATAPRTTAIVSMAAGVLVAALVLLVGMSLAPQAVSASRSLASSSMHQSELLVLAVVGALLLAALVPSRHRALAVGAVAVCEAAILFAIPLLAWPASNPVDEGVVRYLTHHVGNSRFYSLGAPTANFGSQIGVRQLDVIDLPIPKALVPIERSLDRYERPALFTGVRRPVAGAPSTATMLLRHLSRFESLGVRYVVAPTGLDLFARRPHEATLAYHDATFQIWRLHRASPLARAPGCGLRTIAQDAYVASCRRASTLVRLEIAFPGWTATVNGHAVPVLTRNHLQAVALPPGHSVIAMTYLPPGVPLATVASVAGLLCLLLPYEEIAQWRRERRQKPVFAEWEPVPTGGSGSGTRPANEPATGALPAIRDDEEPATSGVPAVTGTVQAVGGDEEGPPTSAVAVETAARTDAPDPPTLAVPATRPDDPTLP